MAEPHSPPPVSPPLWQMLPLLAIAVVVRGAVLAKLWEWFVAGTFEIHAISTWEAVGLSTIVAFVTPVGDDRPFRPFTESLFLVAFLACAFLGIGWVALQFAR